MVMNVGEEPLPLTGGRLLLVFSLILQVVESEGCDGNHPSRCGIWSIFTVRNGYGTVDDCADSYHHDTRDRDGAGVSANQNA